jgi:hypothetical protein
MMRKNENMLSVRSGILREQRRGGRRMVVNPFWFGVLVCLVAEIILILLLGIIRGIFGVSNHDDHETEIRQIDLPEELQEKVAEEIRRQERGGKDG